MAPEPGDQDLQSLNRTYRPALMAFFLRRLRNHAEAEDLTQDVFVRLAQVAPSSLESSRAYIFQVAANLLRDRARREKVRFDYRAELASDYGRGIEPLHPARILGGAQALASLEAGLRSLPQTTRDIFVLYKLESVEKKAIAEAYGLSISAVDRHLTKAMVQLAARVLEALE
jgi:RNA polymerase sigma factor (sigma-70 family)